MGKNLVHCTFMYVCYIFQGDNQNSSVETISSENVVLEKSDTLDTVTTGTVHFCT